MKWLDGWKVVPSWQHAKKNKSLSTVFFIRQQRVERLKKMSKECLKPATFLDREVFDLHVLVYKGLLLFTWRMYLQLFYMA